MGDYQLAGIGVDIVEIRRFREARQFERLCEYVLTEGERAAMRESRDAVQFVASRFAAKEAVIKAFPSALTWQDIEIVKEGNAPSAVVRHPSASNYRTRVSISHAEEYAVGMASVSPVA